jgi:hypothetical protein
MDKRARKERCTGKGPKGYNHGCRCPGCTAKHKRTMSEYRQRLIDDGETADKVWGHKPPRPPGWESHNKSHTTRREDS